MTDSLCYAYNKEGQRCDQNAGAGHGELHTFTVTWDDGECFTPADIADLVETKVAEALRSGVGVPLQAVPEPEPAPPAQAEKCFACGHKFHEGVCVKVIDKDFDPPLTCGCTTAVG